MGILNFPFIHWWILSYSVYLLTAECLSGCVKVPYFQYQPETVTSMGLKIPVAQYTPTSDLCIHPDARAFEFWFKWSVLILKQFGFYVILRRILDAICNFFFFRTCPVFGLYGLGNAEQSDFIGHLILRLCLFSKRL